MKRIRIQRQRGRRECPWPDVLALDPRDPDVVRAKTSVSPVTDNSKR
jgi:hypothetical protein